MHDLDSIFGSNGELVKHIDGFQPREGQLSMARAIETAIEQTTHLVAEAGTGTGKTFAYLITAILSGKKTIISTGTRNLQDQIFEKDFPIIRDALKVPVQGAVLKGRSNYLCLYRLEQAQMQTAGFDKELAADLREIDEWSNHTTDGDIAEVTSVAEDSFVWQQVTSTADNCLGQDCPIISECYPLLARKKAQEVDVLIVNHHLLCADWSLKDDGFGQLLPDAELIIIDEAHQLIDTASRFLGISISARQIFTLLADISSEQLKIASDMPALLDLTHVISEDIREMRKLLPEQSVKGSWDELEQLKGFSHALDCLLDRIQQLFNVLTDVAVRSKGLESCWKRCEELLLRLKSFSNQDQLDWIQWFETFNRTFTFYRTPLDISKAFASFAFASEASWVFTSATLSVGGKFDFFTQRLGLQDAETGMWESPFDFVHQSLMYVPNGLPEPRDYSYTATMIEKIIPVLDASDGRAFILFTSHKALQEAANILLAETTFNLLVQGDLPKQQMLEAFRRTDRAVLLGTASFWEGVDVRGEALSCVIIDKLPFASPGDPVTKARLAYMTANGQSPFSDFQLPSAALTLKQGVGRLIRDVDDKGVLVLCDPRLSSKGYGKVFIQSLPAMPITQELSDVNRFFQRINHKKSKVKKSA
ncbi:MAG TPA: ATP-dependent DNA helicase [Cycloclasticus sp.]|nr:ATP-dependent DNA helicase [Cycloclasticus sp.]HIL92323.1 ATP-dependent DNA helicase [Cycloclasticus sp.]